MKLRKVRLPRQPVDIGATGFFLIALPVTYWFEVFVILPTQYEIWSFWYNWHFVWGSLVFANITSCLMAVTLVDTSIQGRMIPTTPDSSLCAVCEAVIPPRSWHCDCCKTCILKRDHHCIFTSCCIGYFNQRYFVMLVFYLALGTLYASYINFHYAYEHVQFNDFFTMLQIVFPLFMVFMKPSGDQLFLGLFVVNIVGCLFTGALFYYHINLVLKGITTYEKGQHIYKYDLGYKKNFAGVFGERWRIAWIYPFIKSELPHNGVRFETSIKNE